MIKRTRTLLISHVIFGTSTGFVISTVVVLIGKYLFIFNDPRASFVLIIVTTLVCGIFFLGVGIYEAVVETRETRRLFNYLGSSYQENVLGIAQSMDESRQIRLMSADFPKHRHLEELDPLKHIVLENHIDGEPENVDDVANTKLMAKIQKTVEKPLVHHFIGLPLRFTQQRDERIRLPQAQVLLIEDRVDGVYLFRFTKNGDYAGDTWHQSIDDAQGQAEYEYQVQAVDWYPIPQNATDALLFMLNQ